MTENIIFAVGDRVVANQSVTVTGCPTVENPYPDLVGTLATITAVHEHGTMGVVDVHWDAEDPADNGLNWSSQWFTKAPQRPLVHFDDEKAGRDRSAARYAASLAVSKVLKPEHNALFRAAADGESVDAYDLNAAVTAAMRSATTRLGQSTGRRQMAKQFAHLGHIVQAVLENHADNLPGYEPGARSRLLDEAGTALQEAKVEVERLTSVIDERTLESAEVIADLRREIEHAGSVNQRLTQDLTAAREERALLTQAASDERRRLVAQIEALGLGDVDLRTRLAEAERARVIAENALEYVGQFLSDADRARVEGFRDGVATEYDYRQD